MSNISYDEKRWMITIASTTIGALSFSALTAYVLVVFVIVRNRKTFAKNSYYTFLTSLAVSDCILLSLYLFYAVPCTVSQKYIFGDSFDIVIGVVFNIAFFSCLACIAVIGVNRYWAVCRFGTFDKTFDSRNTTRIICCVWAFGLVFGLFQALPCCHLRYFYHSYSFSYDMGCWGNHYFKWFDRTATLTVFIVIFTCYFCILKKRPSRLNTSAVSNNNNALNKTELNKRKNTELKLAFQFGVVAIVLIVAGLSFTIVPEFTSNWWFMLIDSLLYITNNGCNPFVCLIFNSALREHFLKTFSFKINKPQISVAQVISK